MRQINYYSRFLLLFMIAGGESEVIADNVLDHASIKCSYEYRAVKDSTTKQQREDLMLLLVGRNYSAFYSFYTFQVDSLKQTPDYVTKWRQAFLAALQKDGVATTNFFFRRASYYIYKDFAKNSITTYDDENNSLFVYTDTLDAQQWEITDSAKTVLGYTCQQAKCYYHGRNWVAWFTEEIPVNNGPWKLGGLPGLIMEAYDNNEEHHFTINGIQQVEKLPITDKVAEEKYKKTTRIKFLRAKRKFEENAAMIIQSQTDIDLGMRNSERMLHRDYIETDYR